MLEEIECKSLFEVQADALVNPVNCRGIMGKGIALEFKKRYPNSYMVYRDACSRRELRPGIVLFVRGTNGEPDVLHFPTKNHWKEPSRLSWIKTGLEFIKKNYEKWGLRSIAMPQIGCGLGGLNWQQVKPLIESILGSDELNVIVCTPTLDSIELSQ